MDAALRSANATKTTDRNLPDLLHCSHSVIVAMPVADMLDTLDTQVVGLVDFPAHLEVDQTVAEAPAAAVAKAAHLPIQHCLVVQNRRCWVTQTNVSVGEMGGHRGHSVASGVEAAEEAPVVAWGVVAAVVDTRRSLVGFGFGIVVGFAPVIVHQIEQEDTSAGCRLAIRSRRLKAHAVGHC